MEWVFLLIGGVLVILGYVIGSATTERATDRAHKWSVGVDPDDKTK